MEQFRNLYDLIQNNADKTEARVREMQADNKAAFGNIHAVLSDHGKRLLVLEGKAARRNR